jgi:acyl-CoA reductase-like NAD-dependent aldehyde dehydrogenase
VHEKIYDSFVQKFAARAAKIKLGDPFSKSTNQGPQVSQLQYDRIMDYINSGKEAGATVTYGGERFGTEGYFINPTIFTDVTPDMKIVKEEIFGPVGVIIKFSSDEEVIKQANDTDYGLAAAVFSQNINRAINTAHRLHAGTAWINCINQLHAQVPFGGYKQSGIGRELGEYALSKYALNNLYLLRHSHSVLSATRASRPYTLTSVTLLLEKLPREVKKNYVFILYNIASWYIKPHVDVLPKQLNESIGWTIGSDLDLNSIFGGGAGKLQGLAR